MINACLTLPGGRGTLEEILKAMIARVVTDGVMQAHRADVILDHFAACSPPPIKWSEPAKPR